MASLGSIHCRSCPNSCSCSGNAGSVERCPSETAGLEDRAGGVTRSNREKWCDDTLAQLSMSLTVGVDDGRATGEAIDGTGIWAEPVHPALSRKVGARATLRVDRECTKVLIEYDGRRGEGARSSGSSEGVRGPDANMFGHTNGAFSFRNAGQSCMKIVSHVMQRQRSVCRGVGKSPSQRRKLPRRRLRRGPGASIEIRLRDVQRVIRGGGGPTPGSDDEGGSTVTIVYHASKVSAPAAIATNTLSRLVISFDCERCADTWSKGLACLGVIRKALPDGECAAATAVLAHGHYRTGTAVAAHTGRSIARVFYLLQNVRDGFDITAGLLLALVANGREWRGPHRGSSRPPIIGIDAYPAVAALLHCLGVKLSDHASHGGLHPGLRVKTIRWQRWPPASTAPRSCTSGPRPLPPLRW